VQNENLGADRMLDNLKNDVRKNRDLANEILGRELADKSERLQKIQMLLEEPMTTQSEVEKLTSDTMRLKRDVQMLDDKIRQSTPADDKLAFFKTQASGQAKKKEAKMDEIRKLEAEKFALEKMMTGKEQEYAKAHGGNYMKRDDFKQFAVNLRGKNNQYRQMKKVIGEIKAEVNVLNRTETILKSKCSNIEEFYQ
jgi:intraflagellar transport protein 81